ncbi:VWA domain-containing protein [Embleya sp. NPDC050154]|uniref:vWA domain-containing protein n=1 Tax=Embleya sp. NPDC050154 TaxID=3363988 RepID=UPI0037A11BF7
MRSRALPACTALALAFGIAWAPTGQSPAHAAEPGTLSPVMLVLDASGSMNERAGTGTRIDAAKKAIGTLVDAAPSGSRMGLTVYGTGQSGSTTDKADGCRDVTVVRPVGTAPEQDLKAAAQAIRPLGWTPMGPALRKAAEALPKEGPRSIVLVSDGEDTCAPPEPCQVARELAAQGVDMRVHTVGFAADAKTRAQLMCIARASGGTYADAPDAGSLERELTRVTQRALRSYEPAGTPVDGGPDPARAAALPPGGHLDELTDKEVKYYSVDVPAGYTAYVSGTTVSKVKGLEALDVKQLGERGNSFCASDTGLDQGLSKVVTASVSWTASGRGTNGCEQPGRQVFSVTRRGTGPPVPLELQVLLEPQALDKGPAEADLARYTEPGGAPQPVVGGGSFGSATTLPGSGHYTDTIAPGEWAFYRVRLDWGQSLAFQTRVGGGKDIVGVQTHFYNPIREQLAQDSWGVHDTEHIFSKGVDPFATRPVRFLNRSDRQQEVADMLPGWYYIAVAAQGEGELRTLAVDVSVGGTKEPGPVYAQSGQSVAGSPPAKSPSTAANPGTKTPAKSTPKASDSSTSDDSAAFGGPLVWVGLPAALLLGAALTALLLRRRQSRNT